MSTLYGREGGGGDMLRMSTSTSTTCGWGRPSAPPPPPYSSPYASPTVPTSARPRVALHGRPSPCGGAAVRPVPSAANGALRRWRCCARGRRAGAHLASGTEVGLGGAAPLEPFLEGGVAERGEAERRPVFAEELRKVVRTPRHVAREGLERLRAELRCERAQHVPERLCQHGVRRLAAVVQV